MKISEYASKLKEEIKNRVSNKISDKLESYKSANEKDADNGLDMENGRQDEIREAEVSEVKTPETEVFSEPTVARMRKKRNDFYIELALFLILGILMGVAIKKEAIKKVTMGYDDYKMKIYPQDYDLNALAAQSFQKAQDAQAAAAAAQNTQGANGGADQNPAAGGTNQ